MSYQTGTLDLVANRWEPFVYVIRFEGLDFTGASFAGEVRDRRDGGLQRVALAGVGSASLEGINLVSVEDEDIDFGGDVGVVNVPVSTVSIRIDEATMEAMDAYTEIGSDGVIYWDMQVTPSGESKYRVLEGTFTVHAGVTGSAA